MARVGSPLEYDTDDAKSARGDMNPFADPDFAKGDGNFFTAPGPSVTLHPPSAAFHAEKVAQERDWLRRWNG